MLMPDGSLLVSDDQQGAIYRVSYNQYMQQPCDALDTLRFAHQPSALCGA